MNRYGKIGLVLSIIGGLASIATGWFLNKSQEEEMYRRIDDAIASKGL